MTFLIVLGLGISPCHRIAARFIARVFDVMVGAVYAIGMAGLTRSTLRFDCSAQGAKIREGEAGRNRG